MDRAGQSSEPPADRPGREDRLESWKEIAAYLQRDVRTVQRWEKTAGLPIHRHAASRLRTAYALRSEIDAWWSRQPENPAAQAPLPASASPVGPAPAAPRSSTGRRLRAGAIAGLAAALAIASAALVSKGFHAEQPRPVTILQTPLQVEGADPRLAAMLDDAIARQLASRGAIALVAPVRAAHTLRLMRRDPERPLTPAVGREVCVRDGGINFLMAGRVRGYQSRYFVDLDLIDPADGRVRRSVEAQADAPAELMAAVRREVADLGADASQLAPVDAASMEPLEPATTSSLPALRLYTAALASGARQQWAASEALARRAIAADDQFASAHAWLGWSLRRQGRPVEDALPPLERAVALSSAASEPEGYVISGMFHEVAGNLLPAAAMYEAALRLEPGNLRVIDRLIDTYARSGRFKEAVDLSVRRAEARPRDFYGSVRAAHAVMIWQGGRAQAEPLVRQSRHARTNASSAERPAWTAWLDALPAFDRWAADDVKGALEALRPLREALDGRIGRERDALATTLGWSYLALGRVRDAEQLFRAASTPAREINLAMQALAVDERTAAREWLLQVRRHSDHRPAVFASVGLIEDAERGLATAPPSEYAEGIRAVTRGLIAARQGQREDAVSLLRRGCELLRFSGQPEYFLGTEALARLLRRDGRGDQAERLLVDAAAQRTRTYAGTSWTGAYWLRMNGRLLTYYGRAGRHEEVAHLAAALERTLAEADDEHPVVRLIAKARARGGDGLRLARDTRRGVSCR